jgi:hypothetical protein
MKNAGDDSPGKGGAHLIQPQAARHFKVSLRGMELFESKQTAQQQDFTN